MLLHKNNHLTDSLNLNFKNNKVNFFLNFCFQNFQTSWKISILPNISKRKQKLKKFFFINLFFFLNNLYNFKKKIMLKYLVLNSNILKNLYDDFLKNNYKFLKFFDISIFENFFYIHIFSFIFKNFDIVKTFYLNTIKTISIKDQKNFFFFIRLNYLYNFQKIYKFFNIVGLKFILKGKYSTLAGGRKKLLKCLYKNISTSNYNYFINYQNFQTSTKLGATQIKFLIVYK